MHIIARRLLFMSADLLLSGASARARYTYTTLDDPNGVEGTIATGVSGNPIVGISYDGVADGVLYNHSLMKVALRLIAKVALFLVCLALSLTPARAQKQHTPHPTAPTAPTPTETARLTRAYLDGHRLQSP